MLGENVRGDVDGRKKNQFSNERIENWTSTLFCINSANFKIFEYCSNERVSIFEQSRSMLSRNSGSLEWSSLLAELQTKSSLSIVFLVVVEEKRESNSLNELFLRKTFRQKTHPLTFLSVSLLSCVGCVVCIQASQENGSCYSRHVSCFKKKAFYSRVSYRMNKNNTSCC
jgi:hypothetical protein